MVVQDSPHPPLGFSPLRPCFQLPAPTVEVFRRSHFNWKALGDDRIVFDDDRIQDECKGSCRLRELRDGPKWEMGNATSKLSHLREFKEKLPLYTR